LISTLISTNLDRRFLISNAQLANKPIIYCNDAFCELTGYSRSDIIQKPCTCEFLYGSETNDKAIKQIRHALQGSDEKEVEIILYKNNGKIKTRWWKKTKDLICRSEISMFGFNCTGEKWIMRYYFIYSWVYGKCRSNSTTTNTYDDFISWERDKKSTTTKWFSFLAKIHQYSISPTSKIFDFNYLFFLILTKFYRWYSKTFVVSNFKSSIKNFNISASR